MPDNTRSSFFVGLFDDLGITCVTDDAGSIRPSHVLRWKGRSLMLYFNDATAQRRAYFAANKNLYRDYAWMPHWERARNERQEPWHFKVIPHSGIERVAFRDLLRYLRREEHIPRT